MEPAGKNQGQTAAVAVSHLARRPQDTNIQSNPTTKTVGSPLLTRVGSRVGGQTTMLVSSLNFTIKYADGRTCPELEVTSEST